MSGTTLSKDSDKTFDYRGVIDRYYPEGTPLRPVYLTHCGQVAGLALDIARSRGLALDPADIEAAAMLHDIGIFACDAPSIGCHGTAPYIMHGVIGADLLRREGAPERYACVAERHTGSGIDAPEAARLGLPAGRTYLPETELEQLVCYADKFFSKSGDMRRKPFDRVRESMARFGEASLARFDLLAARFGPR